MLAATLAQGLHHAHSALSRDDLDGASVHLTKNLFLAPNHAPSLAALGHVHQVQSDLSTSLHYTQRAFVLLQLAERRRVQQVEAAATTSTTTDDSHPDPLFVQVAHRLARLQYLRGRLHLGEAAFVPARAAFARAVALLVELPSTPDSTHLVTTYRLAEATALFHLGKSTDTLEVLNELAHGAALPGPGSLRAIMGDEFDMSPSPDPDAACTPTPPTTPIPNAEQRRAQHTQRRLERLSSDPPPPSVLLCRALLLRVRTLLSVDRADMAAEDLRWLRDLFDDISSPSLHPQFHELITLLRAKREALVGRASALLLSGSYEDAIHEFSASLREQPLRVRSYVDRARAYRKVGEFHAALRDLDRAFRVWGYLRRHKDEVLSGELHPLDLLSGVELVISHSDLELELALVFQAIAVNYLEESNYRAAAQAAEKATQLFPRRAAFHVLLADCWRQEGDLERAQESYQVALSINPEHAVARQHLSVIHDRIGCSYFNSAQYDAAELKFLEAIRCSPGSAVLYLHRARALLKLSSHRHKLEAVAALERAVELDPNLDEARQQLYHLYKHITPGPRPSTATRVPRPVKHFPGSQTVLARHHREQRRKQQQEQQQPRPRPHPRRKPRPQTTLPVVLSPGQAWTRSFGSKRRSTAPPAKPSKRTPKARPQSRFVKVGARVTPRRAKSMMGFRRRSMGAPS